MSRGSGGQKEEKGRDEEGRARRGRGRGRGGEAGVPSCPPIIILTGFNLNNAACGFHRHARARLIISRTNSPTRYPSMVYTTPPLAGHHYIFSLPPPPPFPSLPPVPSPVSEDPGFGFLRASLALSPRLVHAELGRYDS